MRAKGTREQWRERVRAWQASGLPCAQFARDAGVHPGTLAWWRWKLGARAVGRRRVQRTAGADARLAFVEIAAPAVVGAATPVEARLELEVGGVRLRVPDQFRAETLARVLEVLEGRS